MACPDLSPQEQSHRQCLGQGLCTHEKPSCLLHHKKPSAMDLLRVKYNVGPAPTPTPRPCPFTYMRSPTLPSLVLLGHISFVQIKVLKCGFCQLKKNKRNEYLVYCTACKRSWIYVPQNLHWFSASGKSSLD